MQVMKKRVFEVLTTKGPFEFFSDTKALAVDHARQLSNDPTFPERYGYIASSSVERVRFVRWAVEGTL